MKMKKVFLVILLLGFILLKKESFADDDSCRTNSYLDSSLLFSYGTSMDMACSSTNWHTGIGSPGNSIVGQLSYGTSLGYICFQRFSFSNIGILADLQYLRNKKGDIQSADLGCDAKILWFLKLQAGIGKSFSHHRYTATHGFSWNNETQTDGAVFNSTSIFCAIGIDVPVTESVSLLMYDRRDGYLSSGLFSIGGLSLNRSSLCFGCKKVLITD